MDFVVTVYGWFEQIKTKNKSVQSQTIVVCSLVLYINLTIEYKYINTRNGQLKTKKNGIFNIIDMIPINCFSEFFPINYTTAVFAYKSIYVVEFTEIRFFVCILSTAIWIVLEKKSNVGWAGIDVN